jgi:regulator of sirC expression with transglutaminase-like and TPR domain
MASEDLERVVARCDGAPAPVRRNVQSAVVRGRFAALDTEWSAMAAANVDLERALVLISRTVENSPQRDIAGTLDRCAEEVGARLSGDRAFDAGLGAIAEVLFRGRGLRGNADDYYAPANSYLGHVLSTGLGNPITLCCIAILVGRRLELPVWGVNSPGHFLGFYGDVHLKVGSFFDAFDGYQRMNLGQVQSLLGRFVEQVEPAMLAPASDTEIISRCLRNLAGSYMRLNQPEQARNLERWNRTIIA